MCTLFCGLCISSGAFAQTLPDGKGKAEFIHNCTACHRADMVTRVKKTPDDWRKSVDDMAARGTDGSKEDLDNAVLYLVTNLMDKSAHNDNVFFDLEWTSGAGFLRDGTCEAPHYRERLPHMPSHRKTRRIYRPNIEWSGSSAFG